MHRLHFLRLPADAVTGALSALRSDRASPVANSALRATITLSRSLRRVGGCPWRGLFEGSRSLAAPRPPALGPLKLGCAHLKIDRQLSKGTRSTQPLHSIAMRSGTSAVGTRPRKLCHNTKRLRVHVPDYIAGHRPGRVFLGQQRALRWAPGGRHGQRQREEEAL